jgi:hypothetical protein
MPEKIDKRSSFNSFLPPIFGTIGILSADSGQGNWEFQENLTG